MPNYVQIYQNALQHYIDQNQRTHYSLESKPKHPVYPFGWFSYFRHVRKEYPSLVSLRQTLVKATNDQEAELAIHKHFKDVNNHWDNHSFNNYFLDEIRKVVSLE